MTTLKVDIREKQYVLDQLREKLPSKGIDIEVCMMQVSDFSVGNMWAGEHKSPADFIGSMTNGKLFQQAQELKQNFDKCCIIVDGTMEELLSINQNIDPNAVWAAVNSLNFKYQTPVLFCGNGKLGEMVYWAVIKSTDERVIEYSPIRKQAPTKDLQVHLISSLPGIGHEKAKRILKEYGSPLRALTNHQEWADKVDGIGKKTVERIGALLSDTEGLT